MSPTRIALAAVFFVVGALIMIPMLNGSSSSSHASATPSPSASATRTTKKPTATPKPTPTHTPTHTATPTKPAAVPLKTTFSAVRCPGRTVQVTVVNTGAQTEDFAITTDGSISVADRIPAGATRRSTLNVKEDHTTAIAVTLHNVPVRTVDRTANCVHSGQTAHPGKLPHTGADSALLWARIVTGLAAMLTGVIIFWYGRQWPGRRDKMFHRGQ